ncbi:hypothetical protein MMC24_001056 [Lignoscripta atroalba]|nr:hypothetical protein [Lignoscripta atroalba]
MENSDYRFYFYPGRGGLAAGNSTRRLTLLATQTYSTALADLLKSSEGLRQHKLGFTTVRTHPSKPPGYCHVPLHMQVGETTRWTDLNSLTLDTMYLHSDELIDLLTRHSSSLKTVSLINLTLISGTWEGIAHRLASFQSSGVRLDRAMVAKRSSTHPASFYRVELASTADAELEESIMRGRLNKLRRISLGAS